MSEATYLDMPASPPMREVWIWIGHYADGTEGMISADFVLAPGLIRHAPLMNSRREVAERMGETARKVQSASQHAPKRMVRVELRHYVADSQ